MHISLQLYLIKLNIAMMVVRYLMLLKHITYTLQWNDINYVQRDSLNANYAICSTYRVHILHQVNV